MVCMKLLVCLLLLIVPATSVVILPGALILALMDGWLALLCLATNN
jgi:hypothetical protein